MIASTWSIPVSPLKPTDNTAERTIATCLVCRIDRSDLVIDPSRMRSSVNRRHASAS